VRRERTFGGIAIPTTDVEVMRLLFSGRWLDVEMQCPPPTGVLDCVWTAAQVCEMLGWSHDALMRLSDLLTIRCRVIDASRPDLSLFSPGDVRRLASATRVIDAIGDSPEDIEPSTIADRFDSTIANAQISMFTDLLDGIDAGPDAVSECCLRATMGADVHVE